MHNNCRFYLIEMSIWNKFEAKWAFPQYCDCFSFFHLVCVACVHIFTHRYSIDELSNWAVRAYNSFFRVKRNTHYSTQHITTTRNQFFSCRFVSFLHFPISPILAGLPVLINCVYDYMENVCVVERRTGVCYCVCVCPVLWKYISNEFSLSLGMTRLSLSLFRFNIPFMNALDVFTSF